MDNEDYIPEQIAEWRRKFAEKLAKQHIPSGLGTEGEECTVAAANMAISGKLEDTPHPCMSPVIVRWVIRIQDRMPDNMRNSPEWKEAAEGLIGTGRTHEQERRELIIDWLWTSVMPAIQPYADRIDMGAEWRDLIEKRDYDTAIKVRTLAWEKRDEAWATYRAAAAAVVAVAVAAAVADAAAAAVAVADAAAVAAAVADADADAAADAVAAAVADADADARQKFWLAINPADLLRRLVEIGTKPEEQGADE